MRHEFEFDAHARELVIRVSGPAEVDGFFAYMAELRTDPRMEGIQKVFVDLSGITDIDVDVQEVARLGSSQRGQTMGATRVALLVGGALPFGIARQFGAFADAPGGPERQVFEDEAAAWAWLRAQSTDQGSE